MIQKIGIDIVANKRIKKLLKNDKFIKRILSVEEQEVFHSYTLEKRKVEYLAGRFAAKEAFVKAIGKQSGDFNFNTISVLNEQDGTPVIKHEFENLRTHVSISHEDDFTIAVVIIEGK